MVYLICFHDIANEYISSSNGKKLGLWATGNLTYGGSIFVANLVLVFKFNNVDGYNLAIIIFGLISFFVFSLAENYIKAIPQLYSIFDFLFTTNIIWIALIFVITTSSAFELMHRAIKKLILEDATLFTT